MSIRGCEVSKIPKGLNFSIIESIGNSAIYVLGKMCDRNFKKTVQNLANNQKFLE